MKQPTHSTILSWHLPKFSATIPTEFEFHTKGRSHLLTSSKAIYSTEAQQLQKEETILITYHST